MQLETSSERLALAAEFRRAPLGHHSPNLQRLLRTFRSLPVVGKHALLTIEPNRSWMLATLTGVPGRALTPQEDVVFDSLEDAEWYVFRKRWQQHFGTDLPDGDQS
ncbi:MAG: ABC transporter permease [Mesorhizobium sp.]|uniref:ABC transporter permease n=1 Tax=Mesorhizobium sp. TaxID=1871066 RepID=UPI000FE9BAE8|nr:ABC transporter permease [Mesorhizobium sp.]RWE19694.1 MAG: ABC transporter permease [Mesorhizobium sp.]